MRLLLRIISFVFHPLLFATYLFSLFAWVYPPALFPITPRSFSGVLMLIGLTTFILPAINVYFFKAFDTISSVSMPLRRERIAPFLMISLLYGVVTYLLYSKIGLAWQDPFMKFLLIIDALVLSSFIVTLFMKASIHSLSISGITVMLITLNTMVENGSLFYPMVVAIFLCGLIMTSRLYLQVHTPKEIAVGAGVGILVSLIGMLYFF